MNVKEIEEFLFSFYSTNCLHVQRSAGSQMANSWLLEMKMGMCHLKVKVVYVLICHEAKVLFVALVCLCFFTDDVFELR